MRAYYPLVALFFLSACAPATMTQLVAEGNTPLSANQLRELVTDQSLHLEAIDFNGRVQYLSDGHLRAQSLQGGKDNGKWYITPEDQLCMKFDVWYYGDLKCYKLVKEKRNMSFSPLMVQDTMQARAQQNINRNLLPRAGWKAL